MRWDYLMHKFIHNTRETLNTHQAFAIVACLFFLFPSLGYATDSVDTSAAEVKQQTPTRYDELKNHISSREDEIKKLEEEIADYHNRLTNVGNQKASLQTAVKSIDLTREKLSKDITLTQKKVELSTNSISSLDHSILQKEDKINKNKQLIGNIIHKISQQDSNTMLEILLANTSMSSFLDDADDLAKIQASVRDSITSLERLKQELSESKKIQLSKKTELLTLNSRLADQKVLADQRRVEKNVLLRETKNQESSYKKLLAEKTARKSQFEREIDDYEAQLRAEIDPNSFPTPGVKALAYPIDDVFVTQKFGKGKDAKRLYTSGTHNGVDFRALRGTPIKSAGDGIVVGTGDTDRVCRGASYGRWVLISHKNGLSTIYGHLDLIKVGQGAEVNVGDIIGYSGTTGYATGPHLHFSVLVTSAVKVVDLPSKSCAGAIFHIPAAAANAYLDPQAYL